MLPMAPVRSTSLPIGLHLARTARAVHHALERRMGAAGGSLSTWQVLVLIRSRTGGAQSQLADAMGVTGATMTHHLTALEAQGLVRRWRRPEDRRVQHAELTSAGDELFARLRTAAQGFDRQLRSALTEHELATLGELLDKLAGAVGGQAASTKKGSTA